MNMLSVNSVAQKKLMRVFIDYYSFWDPVY